MRLSARVDYALRAMCALAAADAEQGDRGQVGALTPTERIATSEGVPHRFLETILRDLRRSELVRSRRGPDGGHALGRGADDISIADVIRAIDGPLALVRNQRPEALHYGGASQHLAQVWIALRANEREILERTSIADVVNGRVLSTPPALTER